MLDSAILKSLLDLLSCKLNYFESLSRQNKIKIVYLVDWNNSLKNGKQITNIKWRYGLIFKDGSFLFSSLNKGQLKNYTALFSDKELYVIDSICNKLKYLNISEINNIVNLTYPISYGPVLDLSALAKEGYKWTIKNS